MIPSQDLLFDRTSAISHRPERRNPVPESFYSLGFAHCERIPSADAAVRYIDDFIASLDTARVPTLDLFRGRLQLAKVSRIPHRSCEDAIAASFLALHFEMGLPCISVESDTMVYALVALYHPTDGPATGTMTRLLPTAGLLGSLSALALRDLDASVVAYCERFADGWDSYRSGRLSCLGRVLDAVTGSAELAYMRDYRIAEWFNTSEARRPRDGRAAETAFFLRHGVDLAGAEHRVSLRPGGLLIVDNTRAAHGRLGRRSGESLYQFLYGVPAVSPPEIVRFRESFLQALTCDTRS